MWTSAAFTAGGSIDWFFGEKGSIDGGMIHARDGGTNAGTYVLRVKT